MDENPKQSFDSKLAESHLRLSNDILQHVDQILKRAQQELSYLGCPIYHSDLSIEDRSLNRIVDVLDRWRETDKIIFDLVQVISRDGSVDVYRVYEYDKYVVASFNDDGTVHFDKLADRAKNNLYLWDPDYYISSVIGGPPEHRQRAREKWIENVINQTPISVLEVSRSFGIEGHVIRSEVSTEHGSLVEYREFADGRVQAIVSVDASIAAGLDFKTPGVKGVGVDAGVDVNAGPELGVTLVYEFESRAAYSRFRMRLREAFNHDILTIAATTVTPPVVRGGLLMLGVASPDSLRVPKLLSQNVESVIVSVGTRLEIEAGFDAGIKAPFDTASFSATLAALKVKLSGSAGYRRDLLSGDNIFYFEGSAELNANTDLVVESSAEVGMTFSGEVFWNSNGDSHVDLTCRIDASADMNAIRQTLGLDLVGLSAGKEIILNARLRLDDPTSIRALQNLAKLDLLSFFDRADVTAQLWSVTDKISSDIGIGVDLGKAGLEGGYEFETQTRELQSVWYKLPGVPRGPKLKFQWERRDL